MLIDDENLFETEAGEGRRISVEIVFLQLNFLLFPHSRQNLFRPAAQSQNKKFCWKLFPDDICWNS